MESNSLKPHVFEELPLPNLDMKLLSKPLGDANVALSRFVGSLKAIKGTADLLTSSFQSTEAHLSARIEGTYTVLEDVIGAEDKEESADTNSEKRDDLREVLNYRRALRFAISTRSKAESLTLHQVRQYHKELLSGSVRGSKKKPGQFRSTQNYIGNQSSGIEHARFVPPEVIMLTDALENWIKYAALDTEDRLLQLAILHAQFEIIHPFDDGNGRVGRLLIPLFLYKKKYMSKPCFYLSEYLEKHSEKYYDRLLNVTKGGEWHEWILFFLKAIEEQSVLYEKRVEDIVNLYEKIKNDTVQISRSSYAFKTIDFIFKKPIFDVPSLCKELKSKRANIDSIIKKLHKEKIITIYRESIGARPALWRFNDLMDVLRYSV